VKKKKSNLQKLSNLKQIPTDLAHHHRFVEAWLIFHLPICVPDFPTWLKQMQQVAALKEAVGALRGAADELLARHEVSVFRTGGLTVVCNGWVASSVHTDQF
jgi:hypothetical protein